MSWVVLDNLQVLPDTVTAIHCDTRDFYCMVKLVSIVKIRNFLMT